MQLRPLGVPALRDMSCGIHGGVARRCSGSGESVVVVSHAS